MRDASLPGSASSANLPPTQTSLLPTAQDKVGNPMQMQAMASDGEPVLNRALAGTTEAPAPTHKKNEDNTGAGGEEVTPEVSLPAPSQCTCGSRIRLRTPQDPFKPAMGSFEQRAEGMISTFFGRD